jgi:hypothetical protein
LDKSAREILNEINVTQFDLLDKMCPPRWQRIDEIDCGRAYGRLRKFTLDVLKSNDCVTEREFNGDIQYKITKKGTDVIGLGII